MWYIRLKGGLGNQLFQYAFGVYLKQQFRTEISYNTGYYNQPKTQVLLPKLVDTFPCTAQYNLAFATLNRKRLYLLTNPLAHKLKWLPKYYNDTIFSENQLDISQPILFDGYWQNLRFASTLNGLINWSANDQNCSPTYHQLKTEIQQYRITSIHVRLGDYQTPQAARIYAPCTPKYYQQSIQLLKPQTDYFWIFSNQPQKTSAIIHPSAHIKILPTLTTLETIRLMGQTHHHILANSTFSWWAAYANPNAKTTIGPQKWFVDSAKNQLIPYPPHWYLVPNE